MTATTTSSVALEEIRVVPDDGAASARSHDSFVTCEDETPLTSPESARHHSQQQQQGRLPEVAETDAEDDEEAEPSTSVRAEGLKEIVYWDCENDNDDGASSASKEDAPYCRICFDGPIENDPLFRACDCKGSVAYVHHSCLSKWVSDSQRTSCELCGAAFRVPEGIRPFVPKTAILHKACTVAADSLARSAALLNLLPQSSGAVTTNSAIIYLRGYGHQRGCSELGLCQFPAAFPRAILEGVVGEAQWASIIAKINRTSRKMVNIGWRFIIFVACLCLNVLLIVVLSFVDHAVVIPFMFAVILIQLLPAVLFAWVATQRNHHVQAQLVDLCSDLTEELNPSGVTLGFHTITIDIRQRRQWNPYAAQPIGEPKTVKFLTVEKGTATFAVSPSDSENSV